VEGFPPPEALKTVYVEHDLDDSEVELAVVDYLTGWFTEKEPSMGVDRDTVVKQLNDVGFPVDLQVRMLSVVRPSCVPFRG
jgi:elongation factor 3